jgi:hypothetical protein
VRREIRPGLGVQRYEPWWQIPDFPLPESELAIDVKYDVPPMPVDPWIVCANTPDWQHIKIVHHVDFDSTNMFSASSGPTTRWSTASAAA